MLTRTRGREHITPVLKSLHWLPVRFRIDFKVLLLVFKCLNGLGPSYLSDLLLPYQPSRTLRSSGTGLLTIPRVKTKTHGEAAFSHYGPYLWNSLQRTSGPQRLLIFLKGSSRLTFLIWLLTDSFYSVISLILLFLCL